MAKRIGKIIKFMLFFGDGECDEGAVWEAALANHYNLNNTAIVDHNQYAKSDYCERT